MSLNAVRFLAVVAFVAIVFVPPALAADAKRPLTPAELLQIAKMSNDPEMRQSAIQKLGDVSESEERQLAIAEVLIEIVELSPDPFVGKSAVRSLTRLQKNVSKRPKTKYIKGFIKVISDKNALPGVRSEIAQCFSETLDKDELNDREAFKVLKTIAKDKGELNIALRARCIEAIGSFADPDAITILCDLLSDQDAFIKESAARSISILLDKAPEAGKTVSPGAVNKILEMLADEHLGDDLRVIVIRACAQMIASGASGANKGLDIIIKLAGTSQVDKIVLASIEALGIVGTAQAAEPLIKTYKDYYNSTKVADEKDVPIRHAVAKALRAVLSTQAGRTNPDLPTVHKVAELLISIVDNPAEVTPVKTSAVYAIGYLYPKKFEAEHKEAALQLIFMFEKTDTDPGIKAMLPDVLEAMTRVNYGTDAKRWKEWANTKWPGSLR